MESCPRIRQNLSQVLMTRLQELEERFREVATEWRLEPHPLWTRAAAAVRSIGNSVRATMRPSL